MAEEEEEHQNTLTAAAVVVVEEVERPVAAVSRGDQVRTKRHGAKNQHKMKDLTKWIVQTFEKHCLDRIVDVASGKGELAARLALCHHCHVTMIDPRIADIAHVYLHTVVPKLPNKWQKRLRNNLDTNPNYLDEIIQERIVQYNVYFTAENVRENDPCLRKCIVEHCTLLIGMHADSATEAIIDVALQYNKPFVVIPCCVFPNLFVHRYLIQEDGTTKTPVRSYEQFCDYLLQKDVRFQRETLPFEGRNVAIWWDGK